MAMKNFGAFLLSSLYLLCSVQGLRVKTEQHLESGTAGLLLSGYMLSSAQGGGSELGEGSDAADFVCHEGTLGGTWVHGGREDTPGQCTHLDGNAWRFCGNDGGMLKCVEFEVNLEGGVLKAVTKSAMYKMGSQWSGDIAEAGRVGGGWRGGTVANGRTGGYGIKDLSYEINSDDGGDRLSSDEITQKRSDINVERNAKKAKAEARSANKGKRDHDAARAKRKADRDAVPRGEDGTKDRDHDASRQQKAADRAKAKADRDQHKSDRGEYKDARNAE